MSDDLEKTTTSQRVAVPDVDDDMQAQTIVLTDSTIMATAELKQLLDADIEASDGD